METTKEPRNVNLTLVKGGKLSPGEFARLAIAEKVEHLRGIGTTKLRLDMMVADPDAGELARSFPPQEMFWLIKEIGEDDALELIQLCSPEQLIFFLDMEIWNRRAFSHERFRTWLGYILEGGEDLVRELLPDLDQEIVILFLKKMIMVGGGIGELASDEERLAPWDHSFDNIYFITFKDKEHARLVGTFLDMIYRIDHPLYLHLMEGVKNEMATELEELALQFRAGRLADQEIPEFNEAATMYARLDPATFVPAGTKTPLGATAEGTMPALAAGAGSFLQRVLAQAADAGVGAEMLYLVNSALVAEGSMPFDAETMGYVLQRVHGCLSIALEYLSDGDEATAAAIVRKEYLKRLFQVGWSMLLKLKERAEELAGDNYTSERALEGLKARRPRFYRALDPDRVDGYREFRELEDVRKMEELLASLGHGRGK